MTHQMQATALDQITELLADNGFDGLASAVAVLLNEVMQNERAHALGPACINAASTAGATPTASSPRRSTPGSGR